MNRRDFIKFAGVSWFSLFLPKGLQMSTYTEIMVKLGNGETLSELEKEVLRQNAQTTEDVNNSVKNWQNIDGKIKNNFLNLPISVISSAVLEKNVSDVTIQIPSNYKHLLVMGQGRTTHVDWASGLYIAFNGDHGNNYRTINDGAIGLAQSAQQFTTTEAPVGAFQATYGSAGASGSFFSFIPHINSDLWKSVLTLYSISEYNATNSELQFHASFWKNTSRITSINIIPENGEILAGSLISVYGVV